MSISTRLSVSLSVVGSYISLAIQFASTMVLARLLTPEEIGIYGAGFSIIAFAHLFRDFGLNQYLIQEKDLDQNKLSATFTLSLMIAWSLGISIFLLSGNVARFFNEPDVEFLLKLLSINFFAIPFGSITIALLRKNLKFHISSSIGIVASLLGVGVTLVSAYQGARYFSMAYGSIAETVTLVLLANFFRPRGLKLRIRLTGIRAILRFGSIIGVGNMTTQFSTSLTDALIAKFLGLSSLGFFSRAFGTYALFDRLFLSAIRPTILPLFSASRQDSEKLANSYYLAVDYSAVLAWPFFLFMFLYTTELVHVLYGDQWDASIPLVKILCIGALVLPPAFFTENLFIACGKPQISLRIILLSNVAKLGLVIPACFVNLEYVCIAFSMFFLIKVGLSVFHLHKDLAVNIFELIPVLAKVVPVVACALLPPVVFHSFFESNVTGLTLLAALMGCAFAGWIIGLIITKHDLYNELRLLMLSRIDKQSGAIK